MVRMKIRKLSGYTVDNPCCDNFRDYIEALPVGGKVRRGALFFETRDGAWWVVNWCPFCGKHRDGMHTKGGTNGSR